MVSYSSPTMLCFILISANATFILVMLFPTLELPYVISLLLPSHFALFTLVRHFTFHSSYSPWSKSYFSVGVTSFNLGVLCFRCISLLSSPHEWNGRYWCSRVVTMATVIWNLRHILLRPHLHSVPKSWHLNLYHNWIVTKIKFLKSWFISNCVVINFCVWFCKMSLWMTSYGFLL